MISTELRDAAVSAAKAYGHAVVEPRHVLFAIARRFREHPELGRLFTPAKQALEPRGHAYEAPEIAPETTALLKSIRSEQDAIAALLGAMNPGQRSADARDAAGSEMQESVDEETAMPPAAAVDAPAETTSDILAELDALTGLTAVKAQVRSVMAVVQANTERVKAGLPAVSPNLHLVFAGPPGTGKTTVARLVARLYAATGALPGARFTEAGRADLVAGYVGQTAIKIRDIIQRTRPGVLFIDEAYALTPRGENDYGHEAIATLVKAMEDHRDDLAVIVAGYRDEMAEFVHSNPGLRSRFKTYIDFPNYTAAELTIIFERFARDTGMVLADGVRSRVEEIMRAASESQHFGNARFARSLFENAYARMAARAAHDEVLTVDELTTLRPEDIEIELHDLVRETRRIGFRPHEERDRRDT
jgi:SpoVK/Ycf46/Vps4 family AAA+-type ATPase